MEHADLTAKAHQMFDAIAEGNKEKIFEVVAANAVVWHNYDETEKPVAPRIDMLGRIRNVADDLRYDDRQYVALADGLILQHSVRGRLKNGEEFSVPVMMRVYIRDGQLARFEEYLDPAGFSSVYAALQDQ